MATPDFSVTDVLTWVRTKPADEAYDFDCRECALGRFLTATGRREPFAPYSWGDAVYVVDGQYACGPFASALAEEPHTYGALADRLEALLPSWIKVDAYLNDIESVEA